MRIPILGLKVDAGEDGQVPTPVYRVCSTMFISLKVTTESGSLCPFTDSWHLMVYPTKIAAFRRACLLTVPPISSKGSLHVFWVAF